MYCQHHARVGIVFSDLVVARATQHSLFPFNHVRFCRAVFRLTLHVAKRYVSNRSCGYVSVIWRERIGEKSKCNVIQRTLTVARSHTCGRNVREQNITVAHGTLGDVCRGRCSCYACTAARVVRLLRWESKTVHAP